MPFGDLVISNIQEDDPRVKLRRQIGQFVHIFDLLRIDGQPERSAYFLDYGDDTQHSHLFQTIYEQTSVPKGNNIICDWKEGRQRKIFDTVLGQFVPYTKQLWLSIPKTTTFTKRPRNAEEEVEYFVRSVGLPNHKFFWSDDVQLTGLDFNDYAAINGERNKKYRGRYTFTPELPSINRLRRPTKFGFELDQTDWEILFKCY